MQNQAQINADIYKKIQSTSITIDEYNTLIDTNKINKDMIYIVDDTSPIVEN